MTYTRQYSLTGIGLFLQPIQSSDTPINHDFSYHFADTLRTALPFLRGFHSAFRNFSMYSLYHKIYVFLLDPTRLNLLEDELKAVLEGRGFRPKFSVIAKLCPPLQS